MNLIKKREKNLPLHPKCIETLQEKKIEIARVSMF
jgi:hypothetical protein